MMLKTFPGEERTQAEILKGMDREDLIKQTRTGLESTIDIDGFSFTKKLEVCLSS